MIRTFPLDLNRTPEIVVAGLVPATSIIEAQRQVIEVVGTSLATTEMRSASIRLEPYSDAQASSCLHMLVTFLGERKDTMENGQDRLWAGTFGDDYTLRNRDGLNTSIQIMSRALACMENVGSCFEIGCNIGLNLDALHFLLPKATLAGIEINEKAANEARRKGYDIQLGSVLSADISGGYDLVFTSGLLVLIDPDALATVYDAMYRLSRCYVMVCEYYNPNPVSLQYQGRSGHLFKRDFAGELMDRFPLKLVDYSFHYRRDNNFPADDVTRFLLRKI